MLVLFGYRRGEKVICWDTTILHHLSYKYMYQLFSFWAVGNLPSMLLRTGDESEERGKHREDKQEHKPATKTSGVRVEMLNVKC